MPESKTTTALAVPVNPGVAQSEQMPAVNNVIRAVTRGRPGQPTKRSPELIELICLRIACGESLMQVCQDDDMPGYSTIQRWCMNDRALLDQIDGAYEFHARTMDDLADDILAGGPTSTGDFRRDEARVGHLRWRLGKLNRRRFGDKVQVDHVAHQVFVMPGDAIEGDGY